jgi:redox-sensitive bicupin YhaK (pirin superfamily)
MQVGPHPHIGLQTVTWLLAGEVLHTDSLGSEQVIRPGQLNLMTAGRGVAHAEEAQGGGGMHAVQLWVAQPERTRHGDAAFEHHAELPRTQVGAAAITVIAGALAGLRSPARTDMPLLGAELRLHPGTATIPLDPAHEHAAVVLDGSVQIDATDVAADVLAYLGSGRDELTLRATQPVTLLLVGGEPFEAPPLMWWNFVARTREEIDAACRDWEQHGDRFGTVRSRLPRIDAPRPHWSAPPRA